MRTDKDTNKPITEPRIQFGYGSLHRVPFANDIFNTETFWPNVLEDMALTQTRLIIHSGFLSRRRLSALESLFVAFAGRKVRVCVTVQEVAGWNCSRDQLDPEALLKLERFESNVQWLKNKHVHVNVVPKIHKKFVIIDDICSWEGSLNPLSHLDDDDHMRRFVSSREVVRLIELHKLESCNECKRLLALFLLNSTDRNFSSADAQKQMGERLRLYRKARGWSQKRLAVECKLAQAQIARIEKGDVDIRLSTIKKVLQPCEQVQITVPRFLLPTIALILGRLDNHPLLRAKISKTGVSKPLD